MWDKDFMRLLLFKRHRFSAEVIRYAVWLRFRLTLSFHDWRVARTAL